MKQNQRQMKRCIQFKCILMHCKLLSIHFKSYVYKSLKKQKHVKLYLLQFVFLLVEFRGRYYDFLLRFKYKIDLAFWNKFFRWRILKNEVTTPILAKFLWRITLTHWTTHTRKKTVKICKALAPNCEIKSVQTLDFLFLFFEKLVLQNILNKISLIKYFFT